MKQEVSERLEVTSKLTVSPSTTDRRVRNVKRSTVFLQRFVVQDISRNHRVGKKRRVEEMDFPLFSHTFL